MSGAYLRAQTIALVGNVSPSVSAVCGAAAIGYIASWWPRTVELLGVTPGLLGPPTLRLWPVLTFWAIELHAWELIVDAVTLGLCGKLIEPLWGRAETVTFFIVSNFGVAFLASTYYVFLYMMTRNPDYLFSLSIHGLSGYLASLAVAVKQLMPDHLLLVTPLGKITNRVIPLLVFVVALCLWALGALEGTYPCMWACGTIVSWMYLRFWQRHSNGTRGDAAENFGFDNFFPTVIQPFLRALWRPFEKCLVKVGICPASRRRVHLALSPGGLTITLPGVEPQDMERRRQIALKALSERLSKTSEQAHHHKSKRTPQVPSFQNPSVVLPMHTEASASSTNPYYSKNREFTDNVPTSTVESTLINIDTPASKPAINQSFGSS